MLHGSKTFEKQAPEYTQNVVYSQVDTSILWLIDNSLKKEKNLKKAYELYRHYAAFLIQNFPSYYASFFDDLLVLAIQKKDTRFFKQLAIDFPTLEHYPFVLSHLKIIVINQDWKTLFAIIDCGLISVNYPFVNNECLAPLPSEPHKPSLLLDILFSLNTPFEIISGLKNAYQAVSQNDLFNFSLARNGRWSFLEKRYNEGLVDIQARDVLPDREGQVGLTISDYAYLAKKYPLAFQMHSDRNVIYRQRILQPTPIRPHSPQFMEGLFGDANFAALLQRLTLEPPSPFIASQGHKLDSNSGRYQASTNHPTGVIGDRRPSKGNAPFPLPFV